MKKAQRDAYGHSLIELGKLNPEVIVLDSDLSRGTRTNWFEEIFPDRFINVGISEQNMVGLAAGLSMVNKIPFVTTYAIFIGRAYDQIRQSISFPSANVKIVATHCGFSAAFDGGSHQGLEDIAIMRVLPNLVVISPADYNEVKQAVFAAAKHYGPVYMRIGKFDQPEITNENEEFIIGKAHILREGQDVAILATGSLVSEALKAASGLESEGIFVEVVNVSTIKPLDAELITKSALKCGCVVTAEEHNKIGGLYGAVCELLGSVPGLSISYVAVEDMFGETGSWTDLLNKHQLNADGIIKKIRAALRNKLKSLR